MDPRNHVTALLSADVKLTNRQDAARLTVVIGCFAEGYEAALLGHKSTRQSSLPQLISARRQVRSDRPS